MSVTVLPRRRSAIVGALGLSTILAFGGLLPTITPMPAPAAATPVIVPPAHDPNAAPPSPVTDHCPHKTTTPPAVDESEVVAPGSPTPTVIPIPDPPVGGARLGECGVVSDLAAGPVPSRLTSAGWLIADMTDGRVISAKDPHGRYRPASTIKNLLALVVIDAVDSGEVSLAETVEASPSDWMTEGDSCGMGPRGRYSIDDLLTGLIVVSGNDCANALAARLGGTETTLDLMNAKAVELGALDTRAASVSGLDAPGMSSSPYDTALIFRAAMSRPLFAELVAKDSHLFPGYPRRLDVPDDTDHPAWMMYTSNHLLLEGYPGMLGGKTGYTDDSLKTYVGAVERDGRTIMIVQMFGLNEPENSYWDQAKAMFEHGFAAPADVSVGRLVDGSADASSTESTGPADEALLALAPAPSGNDDDRSSTAAVALGLGAGAAALLCLILGVRGLRRRR